MSEPDDATLRIEGRSELSAAAAERLQRPNESVPVPIPDFADVAAVADWRRQIHEQWGEDREPDEPVHHSDEVAGVRVLRAGSNGPTVIYVHGGGFCLGSPEVAIPITARLAAGSQVVSVDYRLAPEHPHPAALEDVVAVCDAIGATGVYAVAGDSAGAWLAMQAAARASRPPAGVALLSPLISPTLSDGATDVLLRAYLGPDPWTDHDLHDAEIVPATSVLLQVAEHEDTEKATTLARHLRQMGHDVDASVWQNMWHTWHYHRRMPEADEALAAVVRWAHHLTDD